MASAIRHRSLIMHTKTFRTCCNHPLSGHYAFPFEPPPVLSPTQALFVPTYSPVKIFLRFVNPINPQHPSPSTPINYRIPPFAQFYKALIVKVAKFCGINSKMCLFTTTPTVDRSHGVLDPPPHRSRYSAHPPPGIVRLPRGSTTSYREYRRSSTSLRDEPRVVEYRRPAEIEYYEPRSSRRSVDLREVRGSRGSVLEERRSVSRVRY